MEFQTCPLKILSGVTVQLMFTLPVGWSGDFPALPESLGIHRATARHNSYLIWYETKLHMYCQCKCVFTLSIASHSSKLFSKNTFKKQYNSISSYYLKIDWKTYEICFGQKIFWTKIFILLSFILEKSIRYLFLNTHFIKSIDNFWKICNLFQNYDTYNYISWWMRS